MLEVLARLFLLVAICIFLAGNLSAQSTSASKKSSRSQKTNQRESKPPPEIPTPAPDEPTELETVKIDTDLVVVPVIATDANGLYIANLRQDELALSEDGVNQKFAFFAATQVPFHVVLMLDTSASTEANLSSIQQAASAFVDELQAGDRVKVISFDDRVVDQNEFTSDRALLRAAINKTRPGLGTKLYDAFDLALNAIRSIQGRKAVVIFSDGVDYHSDRATFDDTLRGLDEEGVIVYPIRYDTREQTERIAREQANDRGRQLPTIGVIRTPAPGTTAPTFPSDDPDTVPTSGTGGQTGPLGLPLPDEIMRRRRESERERDRFPPDRTPPPERRPPVGGPDEPWPDRGTDPRVRRGRTSRTTDDSIDRLLDQLYLTADSYLAALAEKSGGRLLRADTLALLPDAFAKIAAELRTQYSIGYYPTNKARDDGYRRIKVTSSRKDISIRARPGYRAPSR